MKLFLFCLIFFSSLPAFCADSSVMLQGFYWNSVREKPWWNYMRSKSQEFKESGFDIVWFPPSSDSLSDEGYLPRLLYVQDSKYGKSFELIEAINSYKQKNIIVLADIVLNHRVGLKDWADFTNPDWNLDACCKDDEYSKCIGAADSGKKYEAARDIDHTKKYVFDSYAKWLNWLNQLGYEGRRYDYARGIAPAYFKEYEEKAPSKFSVAEMWDDLDLKNPDVHRQALSDWINASGGKIKVFDFTLKGILQEAVLKKEYWRLKDSKKKPQGLLGLKPENAVTFVENHDTATRDNDPWHKSWPFPDEAIMQGYAYILTHPGIPCVFLSHFENTFKNEIVSLIKIRKENFINSQSKVDIKKADKEAYCAIIDSKVAVRIGEDNCLFEKDWDLKLSGKDYSVWTKRK